MTAVWGAIRRRLLTPDSAVAGLDRRGFHEKSQAARQLLETVGTTFLSGLGYAAEAKTPADAERRLAGVSREFRGFAYEGAAMGFAVRDALRPSGRRLVAQFLGGSADQHVYMVHVGIGWALARVPRWLWRRITPPDPLHRWLAMDGYGFHQAYFHADRYVHAQYRNPSFRWPPDGAGPDIGQYANRAVDQGIGRALWFVAGTDPDRVAALIEKFSASRHSDLFSGAGLAATYAGGASEPELRGFWDRAGAHRAAVAQGSAFAAKARVRAGLQVPHTRLATEVFCGLPPERAAAVTDEALVDLPTDRDMPTYEVWRQRIATEFVSSGRC